MEKFRLLALDIDGTLLDDTKGIPSANRAALIAATERGVRVAIASGRMTARIEPVAAALGIDPIIIAYNGGKVLAPHGEGRQTLAHRPLAADVAERFIRFSQEQGLLLNFYYEDRLYAEDGGSRRPLMELYSRRTGAEYVIEKDLSRFVGVTPTKLILLAEPPRRDELYASFRGELGSRAFLTRSDPEYLEVMAPGVDKGSGLRVIAAHYGLSTAEIIGVGDADNDLELVRAAGLGVAVQNASASLKAAADVVTERTNNEGAVAEVVERWLAD